ncbi:MAG TPA: MBL fold metallo-hydrolase [Nocardioides sp.]|jgi:glyoxylase-like metal-dependent hydrolase (beta-lactamase superfamily II)|uniref:MBL fold metallo-hydrolase n=1 Tax=Nocardioides sp. TaxID=35761 RepID=UPI002E358DB7|nr:MBL fold metallo-hydrolase [Nocardioides sp.]HEX3930497.1 MBL fold metallo-hydrolase [Nocardioides sp.]
MHDRRAWQQLGITEVAAETWRVPLTLPDAGLGAVNAYVVVDGDGIVVIDPGQAFTDATEQLGAALDSIGFSLRNIRGCLITHVHLDHYTNAITLRRELGPDVWLGVHERPSLMLLSRPDEGRLGTLMPTLHRCGAGYLADQLGAVNRGGDLPMDIWEEPDIWLEPGRQIALSSRTLSVVHTPGHTQGHIVLHDAENALLFAGDHVLPDITPSVGFEPIPGEAPLADYLSSLTQMLALDDARLLPAHGPVRDSVHRRVDELLDHHRLRLDATAEQVAAGHRTVVEIARALRWTRRLVAVDSLDTLSQALAVLETKAHLDVLVALGRVEEDSSDGTLRYVPKRERR